MVSFTAAREAGRAIQSTLSGFQTNQKEGPTRNRPKKPAIGSTPGLSEKSGGIVFDALASSLAGQKLPGLLRGSATVQLGAALARFAASRGLSLERAGESFIPQGPGQAESREMPFGTIGRARAPSKRATAALGSPSSTSQDAINRTQAPSPSTPTRRRSLLTNPLRLISEANTRRKTLLGI
jgi:hypothetical protein